MSDKTNGNNGHGHHENGHHVTLPPSGLSTFETKESFWTKYVFSQDHKMIGKQFLITGILMGFIGMLLSLAFRLQLGWPDETFPILEAIFGDWAEGGRLKPDFYLGLVTIHGTIMVFFLLTAGLTGTFANLLIPLQIGARDMASPFLNMLSYWFFLVSSIIMLSSLFVTSGPAASGWTIYPPLSILPKAMAGSGLGMTLWLISMVLFVVSSLLGGINYVTTVLNMRTKGMTLWKMPLTVWAFFLTAVLGILSFPVLVAAVVLLVFDKSFGTSFYLSDIVVGGQILDREGGSVILWEHLFWFLGHPEVYIVLMPALGITSEVISTHARKPIFGYKAMIWSLLAITLISILVWGHHMFITGMNPFLGSVFTITTLIIAVPSAVKTLNYIMTLWRGNIRFTSSMLFGIGLVSFFISGGITGLILGNAPLDINVHDTYFVVAHFHLVMGVAAVFGMLAGVYHWFPKMFGRMMDEKMGYLHFALTFISSYLVFVPMHFMGLDGVPRRYYAFTEFEFMQDWLSVNSFISVAAVVGGLGQFVFLFNFFYSIFYGKKTIKNPWKSTTLEWTAPIKHIHGNWPGTIPSVYRWPYDYSKPGQKEDFIPQTVPHSETINSNLPTDFASKEEFEKFQKEYSTEKT